jgi:hypothetical protein
MPLRLCSVRRKQIGMKREDVVISLLSACSVRLDTDAGPQGTAFFVAPGYAVTAAHVIGGAAGLPVQLTGGSDVWRGCVSDVRPPVDSEISVASPYPAPDVALIRIDDGPGHECALLGRKLPHLGVRAVAHGYTRTFDHLSVTAETETFLLAGTLETPDPGCRLLKLGQGEAALGMSGAPVLELRTGKVIGMLRTSRQLGSDLGGWVVPADLIRALWPQEVGLGNDRFHEDSRWRREASQLRARSRPKGSAPGQGSPAIGKVIADVAPVITGGTIGIVNIDYSSGSRRGGSGTR